MVCMEEYSWCNRCNTFCSVKALTCFFIVVKYTWYYRYVWASWVGDSKDIISFWSNWWNDFQLYYSLMSAPRDNILTAIGRPTWNIFLKLHHSFYIIHLFLKYKYQVKHCSKLYPLCIQQLLCSFSTSSVWIRMNRTADDFPQSIIRYLWRLCVLRLPESMSAVQRVVRVNF